MSFCFAKCGSKWYSNFMISIQDIEKLAALSRLKLESSEKEGLAKEMEAILAYVDQLKKVTAHSSGVLDTGSTKNVLREDTVLHAPEMYTEKMLSRAPQRQDRFVKVKKIL